MTQTEQPPIAFGERLRKQAKGGIQSVAETLARAARLPLTDRAPLAALPVQSQERIRRHFSRPKFFIVGYPRSGTTLLARLVSLHPEVCCLWQAHFFSEQHSLRSALGTHQVEEWLERPDNRWVRDEAALSTLLRAACDFVMEAEAEDQGKSIVGDKSPASDWRLGLEDLAKVYPDAVVVHIVRDGRDVAVSRRLQQFIDLPHLLDRKDRKIRDQLKSSGADLMDDRRPIFTRSWLEDEAWSWSEEVTEVDRKGRDLYGDGYLSVRFEDLIRVPEEHVTRVWESLNVEASSVTEALLDEVRSELRQNPAAEWHEQADPQLARHFDRGTPGGWRRVFTSQDEATFLKYGSRGLEHWGYEAGGAAG